MHLYPKDTNINEFLLNEDSLFAVQEAYKTLRTNVILSLPGTDSHCIGITSAMPGDGKSTNAINLAISFAAIGKKVILIDCDMRMPTIASKLGVSRRPGLSNWLVGECDIKSILHRIARLGFDILPAGDIAPDPTRLLETMQIQVLLDELKKHYQYIFIDLPPITSVPDGIILSKYIDGFLLVVQHDKTEHRAISEMIKQLHFVDAKIVGFVYYNADPEGHREYYKRKYTK